MQAIKESNRGAMIIRGVRRALSTGVIACILLRAQAPPAPGASVKQLMLDLIHPASNNILLTINRGGPTAESDWAEMRRSALTLAECGNLLKAPGRARDPAAWAKDATILADAGAAAYKAALDKNLRALISAAEGLDNSCTTCHQQYRPNVFPPAPVSN